ncbi:MAG: Holliday junction resolvase RuvX [Flavobacteriales bacterium]|nr:Holliday junction resolvase RuvX [Flavobacteriales bacterium]
MSPVLAIDYGKRRCGIAITDELRIVASPLETVATALLMGWLKKEIPLRRINEIVMGMPYRWSGEESDIGAEIRKTAKEIERLFQGITIHFVDETFTSKMAGQALFAGGMKKKDRQKKENLDKVSAAIILQSFLASHP